MISIPRDSASTAPHTRVLVLGVGNAGVALVDQLTLAGYSDSAELVAINSDASSLNASVATRKVLLGSRAARGLGTGGDPELGAETASESLDEIEEVVADFEIVIICTGLGGGVGSGASPLIAEVARARKALVIGVCTLPFAFEGKRRVEQASRAEDDLRVHCDAVFCFENNRMSEIAEPLAGLHETFAASDRIVAEAIASLLRLTGHHGEFRITLGDLLAIFRSSQRDHLFATGEASGPNRAHEALEAALKNPMLQRGKALFDASSVLIRIEGSDDLRFAEVQAIMQAVNRKIDDDAALNIGVGLNIQEPAKIRVSILASIGTPAPLPARRPTPPPPVHIEVPVQELPSEPEPELLPAVAAAAPSAEPPEELFDTNPYTVVKTPESKKAAKAKQETLRLDPVNRGRFEKSEPTIVGGENLDVPTFIRQKLKLS